ncbi:hypothetical protein AAFF_G00217920 [Aldrovandia affinis]|uniref:Uncharacterized protein n=1 Tax=Aldrovandia affinis TaxID=143900 RepID=A0AAD7SW53_9TELE|nr:hypothetical protein AAFF_G00217920 [Aldrovandia affinis]
MPPLNHGKKLALCSAASAKARETIGGLIAARAASLRPPAESAVAPRACVPAAEPDLGSGRSAGRGFVEVLLTLAVEDYCRTARRPSRWMECFT